MVRKTHKNDVPQQERVPVPMVAVNGDAQSKEAGGDEEVAEEGKIICALTGKHRTAKLDWK